jgi:hypothetical protein
MTLTKGFGQPCDAKRIETGLRLQPEPRTLGKQRLRPHQLNKVRGGGDPVQLTANAASKMRCLTHAGFGPAWRILKRAWRATGDVICW